MTIQELFAESGMNQTEFAGYFDIPRRTVQNWVLGLRQCPEYLVELMRYKLEKEKII
jgi:DNA-binding transcriptional regulator YiaG